MACRIARLRVPALARRNTFDSASRSSAVFASQSSSPAISRPASTSVSAAAYPTRANSHSVLRRTSPLGQRASGLQLQRRNIVSSGVLRDDAAGTAQTEGADPRAPPEHLTEGETEIWKRLQALEPVTLVVQDVSGGCGTMYAIQIASPKFKGKPMILQHRLVNEHLKGLVETWHGVQLRTQVA